MNDLESRVTQLAIGVVGMKGALEGVERLLHDDIDELKAEIERQRKLAKYGRRTWFEVMAYIFLVGLLVSDLARTVCTPGPDGVAQFAYGCDTVFWTTDHGGDARLRVLGFTLQAALLLWMGRRSQVPADIFDRVPVAADMPQTADGGRVRRRDRWRGRG